MVAEARGAVSLGAALGIVRGAAGALVTVEILTGQGGSVTVDAQALHTVVYTPGDRVLILFQSADVDSAVVVGRVGNTADAPAGSSLLAQLLGVDGSGSGLDADMLDGQQEAAFVRTDGSRALSADWDIGAGRALKGATLQARTSGGLTLADASGVLGLFVANGGNVGAGTNAPQGRLHVWDGAGGFLFTSRSGVGTTASVIIANGTGDVTQMVRVEAIVSNGAAVAYSTFGLTIGGVVTQNVTVGSDTYQFRLNGDGSLDVRRTAGSNAGKAVVRAMWC